TPRPAGAACRSRVYSQSLFAFGLPWRRDALAAPWLQRILYVPGVRRRNDRGSSRVLHLRPSQWPAIQAGAWLVAEAGHPGRSPADETLVGARSAVSLTATKCGRSSPPRWTCRLL